MASIPRFLKKLPEYTPRAVAYLLIVIVGAVGFWRIQDNIDQTNHLAVIFHRQSQQDIYRSCNHQRSDILVLLNIINETAKLNEAYFQAEAKQPLTANERQSLAQSELSERQFISYAHAHLNPPNCTAILDAPKGAAGPKLSPGHANNTP